MPKITPMFKPAGLNKIDADGDAIQFIEPGRKSASARIGFPTMQIGATNYPITSAKLKMNFGVGSA